jgi:hypothetical protein
VRRATGRLAVLSLLLAAAPCGARTWPDCLHSGPKKTAPATLADLRACQRKAARRVSDQAEARGKPLTDAELDSLGDHQRDEARRFLVRPGAVVADPAAPAAERASETKPDGENASGPPRHKDVVANASSSAMPRKAPPEMKEAADAILQRYKDAGVKQVPPEDIADFKTALQKSGGVMTPAFDRMVDERIRAAQAAAPAAAEDKPSDSDAAPDSTHGPNNDDGAR